MGLFKQLKINDSVGYTYSGVPEPLTFIKEGGGVCTTKYCNSNDGDILVWTDYSGTVEVDFGSFKKTYITKLMSRLFWERVLKLIGYNYSEIYPVVKNYSAFLTSEYINTKEAYGLEYSSNTWKVFASKNSDKKYGFII